MPSLWFHSTRYTVIAAYKSCNNTWGVVVMARGVKTPPPSRCYSLSRLPMHGPLTTENRDSTPYQWMHWVTATITHITLVKKTVPIWCSENSREENMKQCRCSRRLNLFNQSALKKLFFRCYKKDTSTCNFLIPILFLAVFEQDFRVVYYIYMCWCVIRTSNFSHKVLTFSASSQFIHISTLGKHNLAYRLR